MALDPSCGDDSFQWTWYQFNPSCRPTQTILDDFREYLTVRYWATERLWPNRPWRLENFPPLPRCSISNPLADEDAAECEYAYNVYQSRCSRLRAISLAFPNILRDPYPW
jgi:hypothetical protein